MLILTPTTRYPMHPLLLLIICLLTCLPSGYADEVVKPDAAVSANPTPVPAQNKQTTANPTPRSFNAAQLEEFRKDKHYQYHQTQNSNGWFSRLLNWIEKWLGKISPSTKVTNGVFDVVQILLWVALLVLALRVLLNVKMIDLFRKKTSSTVLPYDIVTENIHELNFDGLIAQAVAEQDFRRAIRYLYIKCLKKLTDQTIIQWQPNKTNRDYLLELQNTPWFAPFNKITRTFNYVWYGNFTLTHAHFNRLLQDFSQFEATLKPVKA